MVVNNPGNQGVVEVPESYRSHDYSLQSQGTFSAKAPVLMDFLGGADIFPTVDICLRRHKSS